MNERLWQQAIDLCDSVEWDNDRPETYWAEPALRKLSFTLDQLETFVHDIVGECVSITLKDALPEWGNDASEANAQCIKIAADLKQHFGVE